MPSPWTGADAVVTSVPVNCPESIGVSSTMTDSGVDSVVELAPTWYEPSPTRSESVRLIVTVSLQLYSPRSRTTEPAQGWGVPISQALVGPKHDEDAPTA